MERLRPAFNDVDTRAALIALCIGLAAGTVVAGFGAGSRMAPLANAASIAGGLWTDALRFIVYPLVVCLLVKAIAGSSEALLSRAGAVTLSTYLFILLCSATLALVLAPRMMRAMDVEWAALEATASAPPGDAASGGFLQGVANTIAQNALLRLILLTFVFALALKRIEETPRRRLLDVFEAFLDVTLVLLRWLLKLAPAAIFALAFSTAALKGFSATRIMGTYVAIEVILLLLLLAMLYAIAVAIGNVSLRAFSKAALPSQTMAVTTRSSMACLPTLLESGQELGISPVVNAFVTPLSVSVFRANRMATTILKLLFLAHVYGVTLQPSAVLVFVAALFVLSFASPGTPGAGMYNSVAPIMAMGVPMEGLLMAAAVDLIPDIFRTLVNVTGDLTASAVVDRMTPRTAASGLAVAASTAE